jgi:asparagine synthase (glutamine-hydrolysing)
LAKQTAPVLEELRSLQRFGRAGQVHVAISGRVHFDRLRPGPLERVDEDQDRVWVGDGMAVLGRGKVQRATTTGGWEVFVLGEAQCAELVGQVLDEVLPPDDDRNPELSPAASRRLCWGLLPSAAVVAIRPSTRTACLIRDGCGFRPLYYSERSGALSFSTNLGSVRDAIQPTGINTDKINEMLVFGHRTGSRTIWQRLDVVPPGSLVHIGPSGRHCPQFFWGADAMFEVGERRRLEHQPLEETLRELEATIHEATAPSSKQPRVGVPCGGGVDSSYLGAHLKHVAKDVAYWCINQPEAERREQDWMEPLSRALGIRCEYVHMTRSDFLTQLVATLDRVQQPLMGPNAVPGYLMRTKALQTGTEAFVSGELADTLLGGLKTFNQLSPRFRLLRTLSRLPRRVLHWSTKAMADLPTWLVDSTRVVSGPALAAVSAGDVERAEALREVVAFEYEGQSDAQRMADLLTFSDLRLIPSALHHVFFERDELHGGTMLFPFADPHVVRFGLHLPVKWKYRNGSTKWLWRTLASKHLGRDVAFRPKYAFPTLTSRWLDRAGELLRGGFLEDLLNSRISTLYAALPEAHPSRWTLVNIELWGRLHCRNEGPEFLLRSLL